MRSLHHSVAWTAVRKNVLLCQNWNLIQQCGRLPEVALLPGHGVEQGGDDEERAEPGPVHPGGQSFPLVLRVEVQQGAAQQAGDYP